MKYIFYISILISSLVFLSGCGRENRLEGLDLSELAHNFEIDNGSFYGSAKELRIIATNDRSQLLRRAIRKFEDTNSGWMVNITPFFEVECLEEISTIMQNGEIDLVDVSWLNHETLEESHLLADFLHLWNPIDYYEMLDSLLPFVGNYMRMTSHGGVHRIPISFGIWSLWPNQFNDYTLEYVREPSVGWTWNDLVTLFEYDMKQQYVSYLFPFPATHLTSILLSYYHGQSELDLSIVEEVLKIVDMLNERNLIPSDWGAFEYSLLSVNMFGGIVRDFSIYLTPYGRVYLFPEIESVTGMSAILTPVFAINAKTTSEQQRAAADFVKILLSTEFQNDFRNEDLSPIVNELSTAGVFANSGGGLFINGIDTGRQVSSLSRDEMDLYNRQRQDFFDNTARVGTNSHIAEFSSEIAEVAMMFYNRQMTMEAVMVYLRDRFFID